MFEAICDAILREMDDLEEKYSKGAQMSAQDLEHIDRMAHALKNISAYAAMKEGCDHRSRRRYEYEPYRRY